MEKAKIVIGKNLRKRSAAEWEFRWLWNEPEVTCILSGINFLEMVQENIKVAEDITAGEFTKRILS